MLHTCNLLIKAIDCIFQWFTGIINPRKVRYCIMKNKWANRDTLWSFSRSVDSTWYSISQEWAHGIELNTRAEIPYLQATMYYFIVYYKHLTNNKKSTLFTFQKERNHSSMVFNRTSVNSLLPIWNRQNYHNFFMCRGTVDILFFLEAHGNDNFLKENQFTVLRKCQGKLIFWLFSMWNAVHQES